VVRTLEATLRELTQAGHQAQIVGPKSKGLFTFPTPSYPEIKLEFFARPRLSHLIQEFAPDFIHIATEGPLGWAARGVCLAQGRPFTTSYHTRFPEYLAARVPNFLARPISFLAYAILRRFHTPAGAVMVSTASMERTLRAHKFHRLVRWSRGVDTGLFYPYGKTLAVYENLPRPILLYVGRVAVEKNLRAFLDLHTTGSLVVIGEGPDLPALRVAYSHAHFLGKKEGQVLARHYAAADLFVFPSTTDTFGLVLLEACAAGLRVAACPAPGPADIFVDSDTHSFASLDDSLQDAVNRSLSLPDNPDIPRTFAARFSWPSCAAQFLAHLQAPSPKAKRRLLRWRKKIGEGM